MIKFLLEIELDGYENEEEMAKACENFIFQNLNHPASIVKFRRIKEKPCVKNSFHFKEFMDNLNVILDDYKKRG